MKSSTFWTILLFFLGGLCRASSSHVYKGTWRQTNSLRASTSKFVGGKTESHGTCNEYIPQCLSCTTECSFISQNPLRERLLNASIALGVCRQELINAGVPNWCVIRSQGYGTQPGFHPGTSVCKVINTEKCVNAWASEVETDALKGKLSGGRVQSVLASKARDFVKIRSAWNHLHRQAAKYDADFQLFHKEMRERLLEQARQHLRRVDDKTTAFADPLFNGIYEMTAENEKLDMRIYRSDAYSAGIENKFVQRDTVDKVPALLQGISDLQNHIQSRKQETGFWLQDIKSSSRKTAAFQQKAAHLIYETTHAKNVDGVLSHMDKELYDLYVVLRKERAQLSNLNLKATVAKQRLVGALRQLVREISRTQSAKRCSPTEMVAWSEFTTAST